MTTILHNDKKSKVKQNVSTQQYHDWRRGEVQTYFHMSIWLQSLFSEIHTNIYQKIAASMKAQQNILNVSFFVRRKQINRY